MFRFFKALFRLTSAVERSAELFETANAKLEEQLAVDKPQAIEHRNGRTERRAQASLSKLR